MFFQIFMFFDVCKCSIVCKPHGYWVYDFLLLSKEWLCEYLSLFLFLFSSCEGKGCIIALLKKYTSSTSRINTDFFMFSTK
nr:MAG TPA: hypothetical protein [Caudoviricetes sp.]